jgi:hypothetical protein
MGRALCRNSVDLAITGIDRNRRTPERILCSERAFSGTKKFITPGRNALANATIKATECLKAWWDQDLIHRDQGRQCRRGLRQHILWACISWVHSAGRWS